ncbi:MAG: hypothetical protein H6978_08700 [Gammaproteobacteria bacterium]|nr:hypothetical protein [Gammaproteobacteria bacterium]
MNVMPPSVCGRAVLGPFALAISMLVAQIAAAAEPLHVFGAVADRQAEITYASQVDKTPIAVEEEAIRRLELLHENIAANPDAIDEFEQLIGPFVTGRVLLTFVAMSDADPWLFVRYGITNPTDSEVVYALDILMATDVTSGPTMKDVLLDLELIDTDGNGLARSRNTTAFFDVIDDPGGDEINDADKLGGNPAFSFYEGEQVFSLIDITGPGPNSDLVAETDGYNILRFRIEGYLSARDSLNLTAFACYAATLNLCPSRDAIAVLAAAPLAPVPLPPALALIAPALIGLAARPRRAQP